MTSRVGVLIMVALIADLGVSAWGDGLPRFTISTVAGTGENGFSGDGGPAVEATMAHPTAVAVDSKGVVYFVDAHPNNRVRKVTPDGVITTIMGTGKYRSQKTDMPAKETNLAQVYGLAIDKHDTLYVLNRGYNKILKVDEDGIARRVVGTGRGGYNGDGIPALEAQISSSNHMVVDDEGNLIIADTGNHRIRKVTTDGIIHTIGGTGEGGYSGDGGPATEAKINAPSAIALDKEGAIYIADFSNHRIRKISTDGIMSTVAGTGVRGYNGDGIPATEAQIGEPCGVAVDADGYVYIGDQVNNRVRVVTPDGMMGTVAGTGVRGYTGDGGPSEVAQVSNPDIICFDSNGDLYFPDNQNCAIRKLTRLK